MGMFGIKKSAKKIIPSDSSSDSVENVEQPSVSMVGNVDIVETSKTDEPVMVKRVPSDGSEDSKKKALLSGTDPESGEEYGTSKSSSANKPMKEKVMEHLTVAWASILGCCGLPKVVAATLLAGAAVGTDGFAAKRMGRRRAV